MPRLSVPPRKFALLPLSVLVASKKLQGWGGLKWHENRSVICKDDTQGKQASAQAITDKMTQRYGYTAVSTMQLQCPLRGRGRAVSTDPASCCVVTVHTICIMGTSQVFTNKYTFFFLILLAGVASDVSVLSYIFKQETRFVSQIFRVQTSITHRLSLFSSGKCRGSVFN
jgi:hypothetical protein